MACYDAKLDHQPVVAIVGQQPTMAIGASFQQEIDLLALYQNVASEYVQMVTSPAQLRHVVDRAFRIARAERTVTAIILPHDVQETEAVPEPPQKHGAMHSGVGHPAARMVPAQDDLQRAAAVLNAGKRVAILIGAGALGATDEVLQVAETLGAGVAYALLGKAGVPNDLPFVTGSAGWLGTGASNEMFASCDTLFMIGSGFPYTEYLPKEGQARGVQIDIDGRMLSLQYPMEANLLGDSAETLRALLPLLTRKEDHTWRQEIEGNVARWQHEAEMRAMHDANPINPQRVFWELSPRLPEGCIVTADCGSGTIWYARDLVLRRGMMGSLSGTLASMGSAIPYALAAKFAHPGRPVIATLGDGAMQMLGLNALISVAKYWKEWQDSRFVVLVLNNCDLNYVSWEQRVMDGFPKFPASQDLLDLPAARYAELLGLRGIRVETPDAIIGALEEALTATRPVVLDVAVDPNAPALPPRLTDEQRQKLAQALAEGDPDRAGMLDQIGQEQPGLAQSLT